MILPEMKYYVHIGTSQVLVSLGNSFIIFMVEYTYKLRWAQFIVVLPNYATVSFILNQTSVSIFCLQKTTTVESKNELMVITIF